PQLQTSTFRLALREPEPSNGLLQSIKTSVCFFIDRSHLSPYSRGTPIHKGKPSVGSIYLIRHGQASFGADDYDVLSEIGIRQAEILGRLFSQLGLGFDRCLSGELRRQQ